MDIEKIKRAFLNEANNLTSKKERLRYIQGQNCAIYLLFINNVISHDIYKILYDALSHEEDKYPGSGIKAFDISKRIPIP